MNEELKKALELWGADTVKAIQAAIVSTRTVDTGKLRDSVAFVLGEDFIKFTMDEHGRYMDEGTGSFGPKAKALPKNKRTIAGIAHGLQSSGWATRKNINPWAAATNIVKRGGLRRRGFFSIVIEREIANLLPHLDNAFVEYIDGRIKIISEQ